MSDEPDKSSDFSVKTDSGCIQGTERAGVWVVSVQQEELVADDVEALHSAFEAGYAQDLYFCVLDMQQVHFMDNGALGAVVGIHHEVQEKGGQLLICRVVPKLRKILEPMGADRLVQIHGSLDDALEELAEHTHRPDCFDEKEAEEEPSQPEPPKPKEAEGEVHTFEKTFLGGTLAIGSGFRIKRIHIIILVILFFVFAFGVSLFQFRL